MTDTGPLVCELSGVRLKDVALVGGKAASLGELGHALAGTDAVVPTGFAVTTAGYRRFLEGSGIGPGVREILRARTLGRVTIEDASTAIRRSVADSRFPADLAEAIRDAYARLAERLGVADVPVAIRSSATAEDAPTASFAGQHSSFLGVAGPEAVVRACRACYASLFTVRAMSYRERFGFAHESVELAIAIHSLVAWPDCAAGGVMFTLDTETGFPGVVVIDAAPGLGEGVVKGTATPDEFVVFKTFLGVARRSVIAATPGQKPRKVVAGRRPGRTRVVPTEPGERDRLVLSEDEATRLARFAVRLEQHFGRALDIEWAKDAATGALAIVQARPETVESARTGNIAQGYVLDGTPPEPIVTGLSVGSAAGGGRARVFRSLGAARSFEDGAVLVTPATTPDWLPVMRRAAAIVTDRGGRTSHAAIVSRELGVPAVVGTGDATSRIADGAVVTVSCCEGSTGRVYPGVVPFRPVMEATGPGRATRTRVMLNLGLPDAAFRWWRLPVDGIGLARIEFIIDTDIKAHPMALLHPERIGSPAEAAEVARLSSRYESPGEYFVERLARGIARIAASQHPRPVVVRLSDFKSNEYAGLIGGRWFEPQEANPMLGLRGASRYYNERYREAFALECQALRRVREDMGLRNVVVMIPFCRTVAEADRVAAELARNGLERGKDGLLLYLMCEIPSNVVRAAEFARRFDGFSIGSNDLTQLVLGVDRDSADLRELFDERDPAVKEMIRTVIATAHEYGTSVSICGQAPSDFPDFATFLVDCGIDSISVNPDAVVRTRGAVAEAEARLGIAVAP